MGFDEFLDKSCLIHIIGLVPLYEKTGETLRSN